MIFDGSSGDGLFWMTGRDASGVGGITGAAGATIVFSGAPRIEALVTTNNDNDRALFCFDATSSESTASTGVTIQSDTTSNTKSAWGIIDCNSEVDQAVLFNSRNVNTYPASGGVISRVQSLDAVRKGFNLRAGGVLSRWYSASVSSDGAANSAQADGVSAITNASVLIEYGELGPMPNAASGCQIKVAQMANVIIRDIAFADSIATSTNTYTLNFAENIGDCVVERVRLRGGITETSGNGIRSYRSLKLVDCHLGEGVSPTIGIAAMHNNAAGTSISYERCIFDGIDRWVLQPQTNTPSLVESVRVVDCNFYTYLNVNTVNGVRPMVAFGLDSGTSLEVLGPVGLYGTGANGLVASTDSTIQTAWDAATQASYPTPINLYRARQAS